MNLAGVRQPARSSSSATTTSGPTRRRRTSSTRSSTSPTAPPAYGFEGVVVDGTDVLAVYREAKRAIEKAREGGGPTLIECMTLRMEGHAVHDDAFYVPKELFEEWAKRDPIERFRTWLREQRRADRRGGGRDHRRRQEDPQRRARSAPTSRRCPIPATLLEGVYATPEDLDTPHHK